jgi:membrane fusion protein, multidrug efflux system
LGPWPLRDQTDPQKPGGGEVQAIGHGTSELTPGLGPDQEPPPESSAPPPRKRHAWIWMLLVGAIILSLAALYYYRYYPHARTTGEASRLGAPSGGGVAITVAKAKRGNIGVYLDAIGTVTPVYTVNITAQVNGIITDVHYREGQMVRKGDALIDIDPSPYAAQVLQAEGTLQRDVNVLAQSKMDLQRYREAWARNAIARQQLDDQEKIVLQNEGLVKSDQGNLNFFKVELGWCHITAPIAGRVGLRLVDPGNVIQASPATQPSATSSVSTGSSSLVIITQVQPITVIFTIAHDYLSEVRDQLRKGVVLPVLALDRTLATKLGSGTVLALDNQIDTTTGTFKLRAIFENREDTLFPNQFVNTRLLVKTLKGVTLISSNAIQHNGQQAFVFVIRGGIAHMQSVKTGVTDAGMTAVQGIKPGDVVATSSFERLQNGAHVVPTKGPAAAKGDGSNPL